EHVDAAAASVVRPHLEVADRLAVRLDDERLDVVPRKALRHLLAREDLVVPEARDLGVGVPAYEEVDVVRRRLADPRQLASYRKSHITSSPGPSRRMRTAQLSRFLGAPTGDARRNVN